MPDPTRSAAFARFQCWNRRVEFRRLLRSLPDSADIEVIGCWDPSGWAIPPDFDSDGSMRGARASSLARDPCLWS